MYELDDFGLTWNSSHKLGFINLKWKNGKTSIIQNLAAAEFTAIATVLQSKSKVYTDNYQSIRTGWVDIVG